MCPLGQGITEASNSPQWLFDRCNYLPIPELQRQFSKTDVEVKARMSNDIPHKPVGLMPNPS